MEMQIIKDETRTQPLIKEYGTYSDDERSERFVLDSFQSKRFNRSWYELVHKTAGYEPAGSCARLTKEAWGVLYQINGVQHGCWYVSEQEARAEFDKKKNHPEEL
jgi:hypothetical protein